VVYAWQTTNQPQWFRHKVKIDADKASKALILNDVEYVWPSADGTASYYLQTDGSGTLSWAAGGASVAWEVVTAANVITAAECGSIYFLDADSEFQSTLPAMSTVTAGCWFEFYVEDAPLGASYTILTGNSEDLLVGGVVERETDTGNDGPYDASADTITFVDGTAVEGDMVRIVASGNYWYVTGVSNADGGITITDSD
jgi:hypothetical protein